MGCLFPKQLNTKFTKGLVSKIVLDVLMLRKVVRYYVYMCKVKQSVIVPGPALLEETFSYALNLPLLSSQASTDF